MTTVAAWQFALCLVSVFHISVIWFTVHAQAQWHIFLYAAGQLFITYLAHASFGVTVFGGHDRLWLIGVNVGLLSSVEVSLGDKKSKPRSLPHTMFVIYG